MTALGTMLVTGSRQGVGRALIEHYALRGHMVYGISRGDSDFVHQNYRHIVADITDEHAVSGAIAEISARGGLEILINNAALKTSGYALITSTGEAERMIRTNLLGAFIVTREAVKLMQRGRFGRVVNLSSIAVPLGSVGTAVYGASKAGLAQLCNALSREFAAHDITFNTIGISIYEDSEMVAEMTREALQETRRELAKPSSLEISEIAHAIDFFCSKDARNITNQLIYFGGVR